jgi:hypothetical protein
LSEINPNTPATSRKLAQLRTAEGQPLPPNARAELERLLERLALVKKQIKAIEADYARHTAENKRVKGEHDLAAQAAVSAACDRHPRRPPRLSPRCSCAALRIVEHWRGSSASLERPMRAAAGAATAV